MCSLVPSRQLSQVLSHIKCGALEAMAAILICGDKDQAFISLVPDKLFIPVGLHVHFSVSVFTMEAHSNCVV